MLLLFVPQILLSSCENPSAQNEWKSNLPRVFLIEIYGGVMLLFQDMRNLDSWEGHALESFFCYLEMIKTPSKTKICVLFISTFLFVFILNRWRSAKQRTAHLCNQRIQRECYIATHELKDQSKENPCQNHCQVFMETRFDPEFILPSQAKQTDSLEGCFLK